MRRRLLLLLTLFLVAVPPAASAATITYTSLAAFQADSTTTNIDFSGLAPDGDVIFYGAGSLVIGGVTFSSPQSNMAVVDADFPDCCHFPGSLAPATLFDAFFPSGDAFLITLAPAVTAAAFDVSNSCQPGICPPDGTITVTLSNGFTHTFASTGVSNFFGFITDVPVTSITVSSQGNPSGSDFTELTNFRYGTAVTPVPEPASLLLLGTGLAAAGLRRRFSSRR